MKTAFYCLSIFLKVFDFTTFVYKYTMFSRMVVKKTVEKSLITGINENYVGLQKTAFCLLISRKLLEFTTYMYKYIYNCLSFFPMVVKNTKKIAQKQNGKKNRKLGTCIRKRKTAFCLSTFLKVLVFTICMSTNIRHFLKWL